MPAARATLPVSADTHAIGYKKDHSRHCPSCTGSSILWGLLFDTRGFRLQGTLHSRLGWAVIYSWYTLGKAIHTANGAETLADSDFFVNIGKPLAHSRVIFALLPEAVRHKLSVTFKALIRRMKRTAKHHAGSQGPQLRRRILRQRPNPPAQVNLSLPTPSASYASPSLVPLWSAESSHSCPLGELVLTYWCKFAFYHLCPS
jgi:hypothetical protein